MAHETGLYKRCPCGEAKWRKCTHAWWASVGKTRRSCSDLEDARLKHLATLSPEQVMLLPPEQRMLTQRDTSSITVAKELRQEMSVAIRAGTFEVGRRWLPSMGATIPSGMKALDLSALDLSVLYKDKHVNDPRAPKEPTMGERAAKFGERFGDRPVKDLITVDFEDWFGDMALPCLFNPRHKTARERTPATINRMMQVVHHMIQWAIERGHLKMRHPYYNEFGLRIIDRELEDNLRDRTLLLDEEAHLLGNGSPLMRDRLMFALDTGLRRGEQQALSVADLVAKEGWVRVLGMNTKTDKTRLVPIPSKRAQEVVQRARFRADGTEKRLTEAAFCDGLGNFVDFWGAWVVLRDKAGFGPVETRLPNGKVTRRFDANGRLVLRWHDLRATYATTLTRLGVPLTAVRDLLGHSSVVVTQRYDRHGQDAVREYAQRLDRKAVKAQPEPALMSPEQLFTIVSQMEGLLQARQDAKAA